MVNDEFCFICRKSGWWTNSGEMTSFNSFAIFDSFLAKDIHTLKKCTKAVIYVNG